MLADQIDELLAYLQDVRQSVQRRMAFNRKQQSELLRQFAKPMSVGRKPVAIAEHMAKYGDKQTQIIAGDIINNLKSGLPMTNALEGWYDPVTISALSAAERAGNQTLVESMEYLSGQLIASSKSKAAIMGKWAYPGMFVLISIAVIVVLNDRIVPLYRSLIDGRPDQTLDRYASVAHFYIYWFWLVIAALIGAIIYSRKWLRNTVGPFRSQVDKISLFANYRLSIGANVIATFALLKRFGLSSFDIFKIMGAQGSPYQQWHIYQMRENLRDGGDSEIEALDTGLLDDEYVSMLRLYTEAEDEHLVTAMDAAAQDIEERVLIRTQKMGNLVYYALWLWLVANLVTIISLMLGFNP